MATRLDEKLKDVEFDNSIASVEVPIIKTGVTIASGQGKLAKNTILAKGENGKMVVLGNKKTAGYVQADNKTAGALKVVASSAGTGEIAVADVTPVVDSTYTPAADDYVIYQRDDVIKANCILDEDIDATSADVIARAKLTGCFKKEHLTVKNAYTMTANDIETLREKGIILL